MKSSIFIFTYILFVSCTHINNSSESKSDESNLLDSIEKNELKSELDTFYLGNILVKVEKISKDIFDNFETKEIQYHTSENVNLKRDAEMAYRNQDTLFLKTSNNKKTCLVNNYENIDSFADYEYLTHIKEMNQYLISYKLYEGFNYIIINKTNGDKTALINEPVFSPNRKYFLTLNVELFPGYTMNGLELYDNKTTQLIARRELAKWGIDKIDKIKWKDNQTLFVKALILDEEMHETNTYFKLIFPENFNN